MSSPTFLLLATLHFVVYISAGPLPNVTTLDMGSKEGNCALGDVVYLPGDEFPGATLCEKCTCANGGVECTKQQCEPRPGCKALHRPDHCCPTYQCECEQEGRVYGNGEKLVDPADPCRVCYCQGGEVVCRRIACFVRNDCTPRLVPGRCCPEYDNCPLRGVTSLPGMASQTPFAVSQDFETNPLLALKENTKQEFTIKEITRVSEIPVITDVKIKEILPSPSIDVLEYSSSKSPLIPREATSEKSVKYEDSKTESPTIVEVHSASSENKDVVDKGDSTPSKISFSTQDSINSDIYPSIVPVVGHSSSAISTITTKAPILEEEEDHNPAFPPLPADLSVFSTHEEEIAQETPMDIEHVSQDMSNIPSETKEEPLPTTPAGSMTKEKSLDISFESTTAKEEGSTTESPITKGSPLLNLRSVIPTEILNAPASVPDDLTGDNETTSIQETLSITSTSEATKIEDTSQEDKSYSTELVIEYSSTISPVSVEILTESTLDKLENLSTDIKVESQEEQVATSTALSEIFTTTEAPKISEIETVEKGSDEQTTSSIAKSNIATEVTSQTELSSLPIETSDQKPHEPENVSKDKPMISTPDPFPRTSNIPTSSSEVITVSKILPTENAGFENVETTEFILTSFGSAESATDTVELIKISGDHEKSSALIEASETKKNNALTDLINLVSDVASINDHTDSPSTLSPSKATGISESEELLPVNAVYKSKSNYNQNSITEVPLKNKNTQANKQKIIEIEDDDASITDSPPPNDKIEPTTKRPIIDNVSEDTMPGNKTDKKDIEIITQSYVPTINRRPTKVVLKDESVQVTTEAPFVTESNLSSEIAVVTENNISSEVTSVSDVVTTPETDLDTTTRAQ